MATNYLKLSVAEDKGVFEYEVVFDPRIDSRDQRFRLLNQLREITGPTKSFDGTKLFLPKKLEPPEQSSFSDRPENGDKVKVTLKFKSARKSGDRDVVQHFNILFNKIFRILKFSQHNRNFYDAAGAHAIKAYNLSVWPGYVTAVDQYEGGLLLQIDVHHRFVKNIFPLFRQIILKIILFPLQSSPN